MPKFTFDMKLDVSLTVEADTEAAARTKLHAAMDCADTNFGAWPNGEPILGECSVNGNVVRLAMIDGNPPPNASEAALKKARKGAGDLIGTGQRFELYENSSGYTLIRLSDAKVAEFGGDDSVERFRDHFGGDESPDDDEGIADNAGPTDDVGEWAEDEGEFI